MPLWLSLHPLVLASKSDVRGKMLAAAGLRFEIKPAQIDERALEAKADALVPLHFDRAKTVLLNYSYQGIARLAPGVTIAQASAEMTRLVPVAIDSVFLPSPGVSSGRLRAVAVTSPRSDTKTNERTRAKSA
jgi:hypothetical protein